MMSMEKLSGRENYATWSFAVKAYLEHEDMWNVVMITPEDKKADTKVKSKLILLIEPMLYVHIQEAKTAKQVWDNLAKAFADSGLTRKVSLLKDLINTTLDSSSSVEEYVTKIMSSAHKLRNIGFSVDDEWLGTLMLAGLPEVYRPMIMALESSGVQISADLIKTKLLQEVNMSDSTAFYTNSGNKNFKNKNFQQTKQKGPRCYNCNKFGHLSKYCWFKKNKNNDNSDNEDGNNGFIAAFSAMMKNDSANWYIDSGASMHMTMHRDWLDCETSPPVQNIRIADNKFLRVESCGDVTIKIPDENGKSCSVQVKNVLYVPELSTNLLSVSKIIKSGYKVEFNENGCLISHKTRKMIAKATIVNDTYKLNLSYENDMCAMKTTTVDNIYLWHQRMGHLNFNDLYKLPTCSTGIKLSSEKEDSICVTCLEGKQTRKSFPSEGSRATQLLELIHSDVCGPMQTVSMGGARYLLTFIDDYSRKVSVFFIKSKSDVLDKFIEYKNRVENDLNKKIKILRSDNGKEYTSRQFESYLKQAGILHQKSNPYTPEQNGLSERMNRTLIERSKCMLLNANLQNDFWAEAVATAAHIVNRSPTRALSYVTPEELWTGVKPNLHYMRIFGCKAMVHIPKELRRKLDRKSRELIFVGYSDSTKGYRFIDPKTKKAIMSRDVVFMEATVKKNKIAESAPETENKIYGDSNIESTSENKINKNKMQAHLPIFKKTEEPEKDNRISTSEQNGLQNATAVPFVDNISDTSSSEYSACDETYIPDESLDTPPHSNINLRPRRRQEFRLSTPEPSSLMCMNGESTMSLLDKDPQTHQEALQSEKSDMWHQAMNEEYQSLLNNNTWTLVNLPTGRKVIPCKWIFKTKTDENGQVMRYKARLVVKGYKQIQGVDYNEIYAPVVRYSSIRYLLGLTAKYQLKIHQMDAVTAFLQGDIEEELYMSQPPMYEQGNMVCKLNKSIYGLKQASRQWNLKLNAALLEIGMSRSLIDPCIYYKIQNKDDILFITVYVDDCLLFFNNEETAEDIKDKLKKKFYMKDLGIAKQCIGYRITQGTNAISIDQSLYIEKILNRFGMSDCKTISTPCDANIQLKKAKNEKDIDRTIPYQEAIGCLLYLSQGTRPDITYIVNTLSRYNNKPTTQHWVAIKRILRYLKGTINMKLTYTANGTDNIIGYCDADWARDTEDRRSCTGYIFLFQGAAISWSSKKQLTIALSSTEAEYMSLSTSAQEALWLKQLEEEFWPELKGIPITLYCDNQSAISISGKEIYHARSKHIDVRYHFVREKVAAGQVLVQYKSTQVMVADAFTKGLHRSKHEEFSKAMGLRSGEDVGNGERKRLIFAE